MSCFAQSAEPFLPITPEDLAVKSVPGNPNAPAIVLYLSYFRDDNNKYLLFYSRVKILTDAGRKYADIEIPLLQGDTLKELRARVIHPDGSIANFTGKPLEKTIFKGRGFKYLAKTFSLPDVTPGSILEYSWSVQMALRHLGVMNEWILQNDLYTVKERFRFQPYLGYVNVPSEWNTSFRNSQVGCSYQNQAGSALPQKKKNGLMELELGDVAAFPEEDYMPPQADYRAEVICYYGGHEFASPEKFWPESQKRITEYTEKFIGSASNLRDAAAQAAGSESDPERKLRKLYARAQQIRNLSFERWRAPEEQKAEKLKPNLSVRDVLDHAYGSHWEIDAVFAGLARAAGFDASMVWISDRHERSFSKMIMWLGQLDGPAVLIHFDGKDLMLDPGTRFCPYGSLDWRHSAATALHMKTAGEFLTTPAPQPSIIHRDMKISLAADGAATGEISLKLTGPEALQHRLDALDTDEAGRRKNFEQEVQSWLPSGATATMTDSQGWESTDDPLTATFKLEIPALAAVTGKRLVVPTYILSSVRKGLFANDSRMYPISLPYPFVESDEVTVQWPDGYSVEEPPYRRKAQLSYAGYEVSASIDEKQAVTTRVLRLGEYSLPPEKYPELKNLFTVAQAGDSSQAVLQAKQTAASTGSAK